MMMPDLALQTAIRSALIASPVITGHITPDRIRAGSIRSEDLPAIVLAPVRVKILGRAAGHQIVAELRSMVQVWAVDDGSTVPYEIAAAATAALMDAPRSEGFQIDEWERPALSWVSDVRAEVTHAHAAIGLRATIRYKVNA